MESQSWLRYLALLALWLGWAAGFAQCPRTPEVWMDKVKTIERSGDPWPTKIDQLEKLKSLFEACSGKQDSVYARIIHRLGDMHRLTGDFNKGIRYTCQAISINRSGQPTVQEAFLANSYYNLGYFYSLLSLFEESRLYYDSCIAIGLKYPGKNSIALEAFGRKAFSLFTTGDYQRSLENADHGLLLARELRDPENEAYLLIQKAQSQLALNQMPEAEMNIQDAIKILSARTRNLADTAGQEELLASLASSYSVYANLLKRKKHYQESIHNYSKAFDLNFQIKNLIQCSRDRADLGLLFDVELHAPDQALDHYGKSLKLLQQTGNVYQKALVYNNMGVAYWRQHDTRKALQHFQKGLTELGFKASGRHNKTASDRFRSPDDESLLATLLGNSGEMLLELYKKEQDSKYLSAALNNFKATDKAIDRMRWQQTAVRSQLFWREKTKEIYEFAIETCYLRQDIDNAFYFFEKSRAVLLNDKISELGAQEYLSPVDLKKEQDLRIQLFSLQQQLSSLDDSSTQFRQLSLEWHSTQQSLEKFIKGLEKKYPTYYQYKYDTVTYKVSDVRSRLLKADQTLVAYFTGKDHLYVLTIKPDTATISQIDGKEYQAKATELLRLCADRSLLNQHYAAYRRLAQDLYESFFRPLKIQTSRVILSPDDHLIPFEILLTDKADPASFLLKDHAFSYTYSARFLLRNISNHSPTPLTLLGIAPLRYQPYLRQQPLPGADQSLQLIKPYFASASFLIRETATKKQFLQHLPAHTVVHLYSHAQADSLETEPVLYLRDSTLRLSELQLLGSLPTRLIVLSACNTATGKNMRGEGIFSLARGFAAAGIPASITTLWQIDNQTTYQLAELFYKHLSRGLTTDMALREAKLEFLRTHDKTHELPYFWAGSVLIGKSEKFVGPDKYMPAKASYLAAGIILILFIVAVFLLYRNKRHKKLPLFHNKTTGQ